MIARRWRVWTSSEHAGQLTEYLSRTGVADALATDGNRGALLLREDGDGEEVPFTLLTFWENLDAVRAFAGPSIERAVLYPGDSRFFSRYDEEVEHVDVAATAGLPTSGEGDARVVADRRPMTGSSGMHLDLLDEEFTVARLPADEPLPGWVGEGGRLMAIVRSESELSIVVPSTAVPPRVTAVGPWRAMRVRGPLAFELTGILAGLAVPLAQAQVSIFAISTYDTDYVLVRTESVGEAVAALRDAGLRFGGPEGS